MITVYIESTIPSYLTAEISKLLVVAGQQELTREWWNDYRQNYDVYTSELVIEEVQCGNPEKARKRMDALEGVQLLQSTEEAEAIAVHLIDSGIIPEKAAEDAGHVGIATVHGMDILLTWNCTHLANGNILKRMNQAVRSLGYEPPAICTPAELMGGEEK